MEFLIFFALSISVFISLGLFLAVVNTRPLSSRTKKQTSEGDDTLPKIPKNLAQLYRMMNYEQFEIFSTALIIARGEGHRFKEHSGKAGDKGIDARLYNIYDNIVAVQSKLYAQENQVEPTHVRDFIGAVTVSEAVYGFFVTTSTFTDAAQRAAYSSKGRVRTIDGQQIEMLLQHRAREVALAYKDVLSFFEEE